MSHPHRGFISATQLSSGHYIGHHMAWQGLNRVMEAASTLLVSRCFLAAGGAPIKATPDYSVR